MQNGPRSQSILMGRSWNFKATFHQLKISEVSPKPETGREKCCRSGDNLPEYQLVKALRVSESEFRDFQPLASRSLLRGIRRMQAINFGEFEADIQNGELRKNGRRIRLQGKPFRILAMLLERPGEVVTREQLRQQLWPTGTYVDFDHSLNIAIAKLRRALSDSTENPLYVETLVGRGYRFSMSAQPRKKGKIRLAVLPFANPGAPEQTCFGDAISEEIIIRLGHLFTDELGVIAGTSTLRYKDTNKSVAKIGRELKADYILEGTVRGVGDRMRITARLIRAIDQTHMWADRYDVDFGDVLTIQDKVYESIAECLGMKLLSRWQAPTPKTETTNHEAFLDYVKGRYHQSRHSEAGLRKSIEYFERAIQRDENYGAAYGALANSRAMLGIWGYERAAPQEFFPLVKACASKGLEINSSLSECHTTLAVVKYLFEWDWQGTEKLLLRATQLNPSDAIAHAVYSYFLSSRSRHEEAILESRCACEADPLSPTTRAVLGAAHYFARRYDDAVEALKSTAELEPTCGFALMWLGLVYCQKSFFSDALWCLKTANAHEPENTTILAWLGETYARAGQDQEADEVFGRLRHLAKERYVSAFDFAMICAARGQRNHAFEWLEKAFEERSPFIAVFLNADPRLDDLRSDARYHTLINRIGTRREPQNPTRSRNGTAAEGKQIIKGSPRITAPQL